MLVFLQMFKLKVFLVSNNTEYRIHTNTHLDYQLDYHTNKKKCHSLSGTCPQKHVVLQTVLLCSCLLIENSKK